MSIAVCAPDRTHDLRDFTPIACEACAPARGSVASWQVEIERWERGEIVPIRWLICDLCLPSMQRAARIQHQGICLPLVSELPVGSEARAA